LAHIHVAKANWLLTTTVPPLGTNPTSHPRPAAPSVSSHAEGLSRSTAPSLPTPALPASEELLCSIETMAKGHIAGGGK
jgi:hypothetical protein